jgi:GTPase-associated system helical domain
MTNSPIPATLVEDRLPDWWRALGVSLEGHVQDRRAAITQLADAFTTATVVDAVAYAHGETSSGADLIVTVREHAREHDDTFAADVEDLEPAAMIAAALAHRLATESAGHLSTAISLLTLNAKWSGLKNVIEGQTLDDYAQAQLDYVTAASRDVSLGFAQTAVKMVAESLEAAPAVEPAISPETLQPIFAAHAQAIEKLAARVDTLTKRVGDSQAVQREQMDIQQWLLEEWCHTANKPWADTPDDAVPVLAATELHKHTRGPFPARDTRVLIASTIAKAGVDPSQQMPPLTALQGAEPFLSGVLKNGGADRLFPLAAADQLPPGASDTAVRALLGSEDRPVLEIAEEAYRELMCFRILTDG